MLIPQCFWVGNWKAKQMHKDVVSESKYDQAKVCKEKKGSISVWAKLAQMSNARFAFVCSVLFYLVFFPL